MIPVTAAQTGTDVTDVGTRKCHNRTLFDERALLLTIARRPYAERCRGLCVKASVSKFVKDSVLWYAIGREYRTVIDGKEEVRICAVSHNIPEFSARFLARDAELVPGADIKDGGSHRKQGLARLN